MKQRLLVMNGSRIVQSEDGGAWQSIKVEKAGDLKPGIYNFYTANKANAKSTYDGVIIHSDKDSFFQQIGKDNYVVHSAKNFDIVLKVGEVKSITYDDNGKITLRAGTQNLAKSRSI